MKKISASRNLMKSLVAGRYHYVRNGDGSEELYDFENDPDEQHDLATSSEGRRLLARFRVSLDLMLADRREVAVLQRKQR